MTGVTVVLRIDVPQPAPAPTPEPSKGKKAERPQIAKSSAPSGSSGNSSMIFPSATGWKIANNMLSIVEEDQDIAHFHIGDCTVVYFTEAV